MSPVVYSLKVIVTFQLFVNFSARETDPGPPLPEEGIVLCAPEGPGREDPGGGASTACSLAISIKPQYAYKICAVDVLSEARHIEVYGDCEEYVATARGTYLDLAVDQKVYLAQYSFEQPVGTCTVKVNIHCS